MADIAEGTVTKVSKPMTGESEHGEWTMYKFVVTDSKGDHKCSTFSDSIGSRVKKGVTLKFSYEDNEFTTQKGELVKEWRINEVFGDVSPSNGTSPLTSNQPPPQRTLATNDPDFPYQYGRARSAAAILAGAMVSMGIIQPELFWATVDDQTLIGYKGELAQVEGMQRPESTVDASSKPVEQSSEGKPSGARDWSWFWSTVKAIYEKDKEAVMRACDDLELKDYMAIEGNPTTLEEVLIHCVQFWDDEPTVDNEPVPW